ncbi:hypothetical protein SMACR_04720 [Sordaria macrospora]|uniref:WGS project CABT00000000 data, contig 2.21 n=2 Tax=Sordaria macrospora TaxID=5147 RepID=F7W288_SORMK|nr:uncharacterized protein SMAC_04720 [Sordaria macrospora k-hell]KAA8628976.1 hypothetical protein SMACR_04720 [Sordaria macrospora]WPJ61994.1 hypothetical protein SMAC4_04720 [Sordaria macrospora]CCC11738.1 unnamed protein product [Sordaria macrospora k-hell]
MEYSLREPEESFFLVSAPSTPTAPLEFAWPGRNTLLNTAVSSFWQLTMSRGFKALRRSIKGGEKDPKPHITIQPKSAVAIVPPKKVIKALYDYEAQTPQELGFSRGDFFHVIGRENDQEWYEACNPALPDARGLVPVGYFQALGRTERDSGQSQTGSLGFKTVDSDSGYGEGSAASPPGANAGHRISKTPGKNGAMVYGVVLYDFQAERADELEAKQGEAIIVIAQSNPEWFVAKPIGRLGGPGLIPVSFVEIRDMASNVPVPNPHEAVRKAGIPKVEEWKKMAADYKNSSITLGKFDVGGGGGQQPLDQAMNRLTLQGSARLSQQTTHTQQQIQGQGQAYAARPTSMLSAPIAARVPRYCFAEDKYWFVIETELEDGRCFELSRYYEDFYDFQIALLTEFPLEAGTTGGTTRTLPYMPGPVNYVTDAITEGRRHNLDSYVKSLLEQPPHISRCNLVKQFFTPREGDYEIDPSVAREEYRFSGGSGPSPGSPADGLSLQSTAGGNRYSAGLGAPQRQLSIGNGQPPMNRQISGLTQASQTSLSPAIMQGGAQMKVKLHFNGDIIAIRVPNDIPFQALHDKILDRLKIPQGEHVQLSYKDDASGEKPPLMNDEDLDIALGRNEKLLVYVE